MRTIYTLICYLMILLQGCFAALFLARFIQLVEYQEPLHWFSYAGLTLAGILGILLFFNKRIHKYLLMHFSFGWHHFLPLVFSGVLLLILLPALFDFEESRKLLIAFQLSSFLAFFLFLAHQLLLEQNLMQKAYANLLQIPAKSPYFYFMLWCLGAGAFTGLSLYLGGTQSLSAILYQGLYQAMALLLLLSVLKITLFRILSRGSRYAATTTIEATDEEGSALQQVQSCRLYKEVNLSEMLRNAAAAERRLIYAQIRQIPLNDQQELLEKIKQKYFPHDEELSATLRFLHKLRKEMPAAGSFNDIDRLQDVLILKACIRTVSLEQNPVLVHKLLGDQRPELKKAAMMATLCFRDAGFIPVLVNLLKEPDFAFAAREVLSEWGPSCIPFLRSAKYRNKNNRLFVAQCLQLAEGFKGPEARDFLIEVLNETQKQFQYKAGLALMKNEYALSALQKTQILYLIESLIAIIAVLGEIRSALQDGQSHLYTALLEEERSKKSQVLDLLQAFMPTPVFFFLRNSLQTKEQDQAGLFGLIDLYLPLVLRHKCKILFGAQEDEVIGAELQAEYLQEQIFFNYASEQDAIRQILKIDYSRIGYWLRACALKELARMPGRQRSLQMLAEVFNESPLLQEVALEVLYELNYDYYYLYLQRLLPERAKELKIRIEGHRALDGQEVSSGQAASSGNLLLYDQILFLHTLPLFEACSFEYLVENLSFMKELRLNVQERALNFDPYMPAAYWIIAQGEIRVLYRGELLFQAAKGSVIDMSFLLEAEENTLSISLEGEIKIYYIEKLALNKLYLKSGFCKESIIQPNLNQSAKLQVL